MQLGWSSVRAADRTLLQPTYVCMYVCMYVFLLVYLQHAPLHYFVILHDCFVF